MSVVLAIDCSGSTANVSNYWQKVRTLVENNKDVDVKYLLWNTQCWVSSYGEVVRLCDSRSGNGGTATSSIVKQLAANTDKLILVTDGQVSDNEIRTTESVMANKSVKQVEAYFVHTGGEINLSTCLPFTRSAQYQLEVTDKDAAVENYQGSTNNFFTDLKVYEDLDYFLAHTDELGRAVAMKVMAGGQTRASSDVRDALLKLKAHLLAAQYARDQACIAGGHKDQSLSARILSCLTPASDIGDNTVNSTNMTPNQAYAILSQISAEDVAKIFGFADGTHPKDFVSGVTTNDDVVSKNIADAQQLAREFLSDTTMTAAKKIESIIMDMCSLCTTTNLSFSQIKSGRYVRADTAKVVNTTELPPDEQSITNSSFVCPVSLDSDNPCILISQGSPVLADEDKAVVDMMIDNPLFLLNSPRLVTKVRERLDSMLGQQAVSELQTQGSFISPMTRRPLASALVTTWTFDKTNMMVAKDSDYIKAVNWSLANLFFGNKLVGQAELWLAVVYFIAKDMEYLTDAVTPLAQQLSYRMTVKSSTVALTGLPEFPMQKVPVKLAVWYCLNGPYIWPHDNTQNRLRALHAVSGQLMQLCDICKLPYDRASLTTITAFYSAFAYMMRQSHHTDDMRVLKDTIRAQYQNHIVIGSDDEGEQQTIVFLDGPCKEKPVVEQQSCCQLPRSLRSLTLSQIHYLLQKVDSSKKISDIALPLTDFLPTDSGSSIATTKASMMTKPLAVSNYGYGGNYSKNDVTRICAKTMRPWLHDQQSGAEWRVAAQQYWGTQVEKLLSAFRYFIDYVVTHEAVPTHDQLILYFNKRQLGKGINTLPAHIHQTADEVLQAYAEVGFTADANQSAITSFIRTTERSMPLRDRATMEQS